MVRLSAIFIFMLAVAGSVRSDSGRDAQAEFFAGVLLLQSATGLPAEGKAQKYRELQAITGITGAKADALLKDLRERPEEWKKIYSRMNAILTDSALSAKWADSTTLSKPKIKR